jgi:hypothetical protein
VRSPGFEHLAELAWWRPVTRRLADAWRAACAFEHLANPGGIVVAPPPLATLAERPWAWPLAAQRLRRRTADVLAAAREGGGAAGAAQVAELAEALAAEAFRLGAAWATLSDPDGPWGLTDEAALALGAAILDAHPLGDCHACCRPAVVRDDARAACAACWVSAPDAGAPAEA